jgi:protein O-mannosyl-transferase
MGVHLNRGCKLASSDLAVARPRLPALCLKSSRSSRRQCADTRSKCSLVISAVVVDHKAPGPSLLVAALFALHPINVESVAWVAERKNVLSTFFFLLAIAAYVWYVKKPDWRRYLLVAALFAAGLMAKPMVITLPFVLLLLDYWPLERIAFRSSPFAVRQNAGAETSGEKRGAKGDLRFLLLEKIPLLFLSAASACDHPEGTAGWICSAYLKPVSARRSNRECHRGLRAVSLETVWPAQLALYPHPAMALPAWQWILSALVLISITALVIVFRSKRYLPVGWFWFLGTLVPVIGLVQVGQGAMADRYAYLPLIGIFVMLAFGLADLADIRECSSRLAVDPGILRVDSAGLRHSPPDELLGQRLRPVVAHAGGRGKSLRT